MERVAQILEKDLVLKYQPHLWINGVSLIGLENKVNFDINNKREWCKLIEFRVITGDLILDEQNLHLPSELEPKFSEDLIGDTTRRWMFTINKSDKKLENVEYDIEIIYEDRLKKRYSIKLTGTGGKCSLSTPKIIN
ncbi:MAG: hypothetical protein PSV16_00455 [Flavobacterium sp.]|nr:hypothetical protein [Flavobacterium sp.]